MHTTSELPEFSRPPLHEVMAGVQFEPPAGYTSVDARNVWQIFRDEFPTVQEKPPLEPKFETFGGPRIVSEPELSIGPAPARTRLWFISSDESHLVQFQEDRFFLNWRRNSSPETYPRFKGIAQRFENYLDQLNDLFEAKFSTGLKINQAEVCYINLIEVESYAEISDWIRSPVPLFNKLEHIAFKTSETIDDDSGEPYARLVNELQSVLIKDTKKKGLRLMLTFRGSPQTGSMKDCMNFLNEGHKRIVTRFDKYGTEQAQINWGRMK